MSNKWLRCLWIGALLALIFGVIRVTQHINPWWLRTPPPTPPEAMQLQTGLFRDYTTVVDGTRRDTHFEIDQPVAAVQTFYQTELAKQGWIYRGAAVQECGSQLHASARVTDMFDRDGRTLAVDIIPPATTGRNQVRVVEYQGTLTYPIAQTPVPNSGPREMLIGDWQALDEATSRTFVLCVHEQGGIALAILGIDAIITGKYQWIDTSIRLTLDASSPVEVINPAGVDDRGRCGELPALLSGGCRSKVVDPAAYPGPDGIIRPRPTVGPPPARAPYPAPPLPITEYLHIEEQFAVSIEQNSLTLTGASGVVQTFSRVVQ